MTGTVGEARKAGWLQSLLKPVVLDRAEQAVVVILFCLLTYRVLVSANPLAPLLMLSEGGVAFFVLIRRPTAAISVRLGDWLLATTATAAPLLIGPVDSSPAALVVPGVLLVVLGNCVQVASKLVLRRSFGIAPANRGVKVAGPYRVVRHPMYAGYLLTNIGIILLMPSVLNLTIYAIGWTAQVLRLLAEERLLSQDGAYRAFQQTTRFRLIPGVF
uniref:methyltransferase family protein n=1 Tax=Altererythrobacter segetis TaxID=1104773 RepID=UPI001408ACF7|nr:methyltransferase [Altererythrobacter segetis]